MSPRPLRIFTDYPLFQMYVFLRTSHAGVQLASILHTVAVPLCFLRYPRGPIASTIPGLDCSARSLLGLPLPLGKETAPVYGAGPQLIGVPWKAEWAGEVG